MRDAGRILGLDAWRAGLLLGGILLHGSTGLPASPVFTAVDILSQTFRMGCFFAIAGALSAIAIARQRPEDWARRRLVRLAIPLAVSMSAFPPLIWLLVRAFGWAAPAPPLPFDWYHLWFLIALILYSLLLYRLVARGTAAWIADRLDRLAERRRATSIAILATACVTAVIFALTPVAMSVVLSPRYFSAFRNTQLIAGYLPMFLLGVFAVRAPGFGARLLADWRIARAIVVAIASSYVAWFVLLAPRMATIDPADAAVIGANLRFIAGSLCPPAAFVLILRSALAIRRVPVAMVRLSEASYTVYLLHLPLAAAINLPLRHAGLGIHSCYAIAVVGSGVLSYLFHRMCVRRSDLLKLLLNGQPAHRLPAPAYTGHPR